MPSQIDFDALRFIWAVCVTLVSAAAAFAWLWLTRHFVRREDLDVDVDKISDELRHQNDRITICEQMLHHMPTGADVRAVRSEIAGLRAEMTELRGEQASQNRVLASIHEHLLNRS